MRGLEDVDAGVEVSSPVTTPKAEGGGVSGAVRRVSEAAMEALHLGHHHHHKTVNNCQLADSLLAQVREEMGEGWTDQEAAFCDPACLQRYLRARGMEVG
jgi:hypothetical protein